VFFLSFVALIHISREIALSLLFGLLPLLARAQRILLSLLVCMWAGALVLAVDVVFFCRMGGFAFSYTASLFSPVIPKALHRGL